MGIESYSLAKDGEKRLSANFRVREFACKDGSNTIFVCDELVQLLQNIRDHFNRPVTITSAYRTRKWVAARRASTCTAPRQTSR